MKEVKILDKDEFKPFNSSMLKIGEMMQSKDYNAKGHVILKTYDGLVSLTDPRFTWNEKATLAGTKLKPGTQVLLTA